MPVVSDGCRNDVSPGVSNQVGPGQAPDGEEC